MNRPLILIIEDDPIVGMASRAVLERSGCDVVLAADGAEALDAFTREPDIAVVVVDRGLPDMDGLEFVRSIREELRSTVPVLVVTGENELESRIEGFRLGASDYIAKPVANAELVARVQAQLQRAEEWRARTQELIEVRQSMADALVDIDQEGGVDQAAQVVVGAALRCPGVVSAAYVRDGAPAVVANDHGDRYSVEVAHRLWLQVGLGTTVTTRTALGLDGAGRIAVAPLSLGPARRAAIVASLSAPLDPRSAQSAAAAIADLAVIAAPMIAPLADREANREALRERFLDLAATSSFDTHFQPIVDLSGGGVVGYEALTRFSFDPNPAAVFTAAAEVDMRVALEQATARAAVLRAAVLPDGAYVGINLSAEAASERSFLAELVSGHRPVLIEITEHDAIDDYASLARDLDTVRDRARIAVDDAGAGYAGLAHIRALRPDVIKLDRSLVSDIQHDAVGRAMVAGMLHFAHDSGCEVIAEGIEIAEEYDELRTLGVPYGQGWHFARPASWTTFETAHTDEAPLTALDAVAS